MLHLFGYDWTLPELAMMIVGSLTVIAIIVEGFKPAAVHQNRLQGNMLWLAFGVLRRDPETLLFSAAAALMMLAPVTALLVFAVDPSSGAFWRGLSPGWRVAAASDAGGYAVALPVMFLAFTGGGLCSAGVLACAIKRLRGEDPTVLDGLRAMLRLLPRLVLWGLLATGVKTVLAWLAEKLDYFESFGFLSQVSWEVANVYTIPIMVAEDVGCFEAIRRSDKLAREGLLIAGKLKLVEEGAGLLVGAATVLAWLVGMAIAFMGEMDSTLGVVGPMLGLPALVMISLTAACSTLYLIVLAAVYLKATDGAGGRHSRVGDFFGHRLQADRSLV